MACRAGRSQACGPACRLRDDLEALQTLKLDYPKIEGKALEEFKAIERALKAEKPGPFAKGRRGDPRVRE